MEIKSKQLTARSTYNLKAKRLQNWNMEYGSQVVQVCPANFLKWFVSYSDNLNCHLTSSGFSAPNLLWQELESLPATCL